VQPKVYTVSDHDITPSQVDPDALYVLDKLREAGYVAYLVGGSVRDLLLKRTPKDYDISTSALPEEIKQLFYKRCILIGLRFRLAHIRFGHKIIEVSTFRSGENESDLIVRDNEWGTPEQDVLRRDFTINGLFYDPATHSIIDYVGGWEDIHRNVLKTIGEPEVRFKQDPVRMIRLLKFRARFGFHIDPEAKKSLLNCRDHILKSSSARVLEEVLRMLESRSAAPFFNLLMESGILELIYPVLNAYLKSPDGKEIYRYLTCADKINQEMPKGALDRPILMACLFYPMLQRDIKKHFIDQDRIPHLGDIILQTSTTIKKFESGAFIHFPRRLTAILASILTMQYRLTPIVEKKHLSAKIFKYREFIDALAFLKIRAIIDKKLIETYSRWKTLSRQHIRHDRRGFHHHSPPPKHEDEEAMITNDNEGTIDE